MLLNWIFIIFIVVELCCIGTALFARNKSKVLAVTISLVVAADVVGLMFQSCKGVVQARNLFVVYYILHAWMFFCVYLLVRSFAKTKHSGIFLNLSALICSFQTVIIGCNLFGIKTFFLTKRIFIGQTWWIATEAENLNPLLSLRTYVILCVVNAVLIVSYLVISYGKTAKTYKIRYLGLLIAQAAFLGVEAYALLNQIPVWFNILFMLPLVVVATFFCTAYISFRLKDYSLTLFSNQMADGFAVYDDKDELLYANDVIRSAFDKETQLKFKSRSFMEEWISHTEEIEDRTVRIWENDGKTIYFLIRKHQLIDNGIEIGNIYIFHDTSESIATIQMMEEANAQLEHAAKMKTDFLANMSHEIRTPMNAVIGMTELALRETNEPGVVGYLHQIKASGRNLLNIINDILDFSKIEAGKMEIIPDKYEPLSEINDVANTLMTRIGEKNVELFVTANPNIPHMLYGDSMRIRQVLINLANNAIKFTKEGMVHIIVDCEKIDDENVMMRYHVKDTGIGIRKEDLDKLFVSFQQVDSKRNRSVEGTGLGLAISQRLCQAMGGDIGVYSVYGSGSDFYFNIPQKVVDETKELTIKNVEKKRALFLNDESLLSEVFSLNMKKLGIECRLLNSLEEYRDEGFKDYLFFDKKIYGPGVEKLLSDNPKCTGINLVGYGEMFNSDLPNVFMMQRPVTTLVFSTLLNDKKGYTRKVDNDVETTSFIAPDAKILIVDDNAINITVAEGLLEPLKMKMFSALSGKAAIKILKEEKIDIVFMDHMMPEMDGIDTTELIRKDMPELAEMPIIALTANAMSGAKEMFLEHGMNDFVSKPIELKNIVAKIKQWLPGEKIKKIGIESEAEAVVEEESKNCKYLSNLGIDTKTAISALGSESLYERVLEDYYRIGPKKVEAIKTAYVNEDWKAYTIDVHALKSSSRQIGAMELGEMAAELEKAGNASDVDTIKNKTDELISSYLDLISKLEPLFDAGEENEKVVFDNIVLVGLLSDMIDACDNLDSGAAEEIVEKLKKYSYPDDIFELIKQIYTAVEEYDFDLCSESSNAILDKIM